MECLVDSIQAFSVYFDIRTFLHPCRVLQKNPARLLLVGNPSSLLSSLISHQRIGKKVDGAKLMQPPFLLSPSPDENARRIADRIFRHTGTNF
jgi:hypothetical protein